MHANLRLFGLLAVAALSSCVVSAPEPSQPEPAQLSFSLLAVSGIDTIQTSDGSEHRYFYRVPAEAAPPHGRPLLIWLHGDGGTGDGFASQFYPYTDADGAVVVTPNGSNQTWTHAAGDVPGQPQDAQFISMLIDRLLLDGIADSPIDPKRVYLGGESSGGYMPYYLLMRASTRDRLAAVAVNAGLLGCQAGDAECSDGGSGPAHRAAAAILHMHDTDDPVVTPAPTARFHAPIDWNIDWRVFWPMKFWAQQNGCFGGSNATLQDDGVLIESSSVGNHPAARYDLSGWGASCHKYQLLLVTNVGHVVPQQHERIWQFLRGYELHGPHLPDAPPPPAAGTGRMLWGNCFALCESAETDPDENGSTDGWGYERGESCIVDGGVVDQQAAPCERPVLPAIDPDPPAGPQARPAGNLSRGFFVTGGRLYDRLGNDFIMRGVNHPLAWYPSQALAWLDEIALTGANTVRLVWTTDAPAPLLRDAIAHAIDRHMIPIVELHDVTGGTDVDQPSQMAQYYLSVQRDVLLEFEDYLLLNIANEWGAANDPNYAEAYRRAIALLRDAGIQHTLVVDADDWGQGISSLLAHGPELLQADPQHNLLFSLHMYQQHFAEPQSILAALEDAVAANIPFVVGEFGSTAQADGAIPFHVLLDEAQRLRLGYLAWVWTGFGSAPGSLDLSIDGHAAQLTPWGAAVIDGPSGIRSTSQPASVF